MRNFNGSCGDRVLTDAHVCSVLMSFKRQRVGTVPLMRKTRDDARAIRIVKTISW